MRVTRWVFLLALACGVAVWLGAAVADYLFFYEGTFLELALTGVPRHELFVRGGAVALFAGFGLLAGHLLARQRAAEERALVLNDVLRAIRNVNQLMVREKDPGRLVRSACELLTSVRGYRAAWAFLLDESGTVQDGVESGAGAGFGRLLDQARQGTLPECFRRATAAPGVVVIEDPAASCVGCPAASSAAGCRAVVGRLECDGVRHGLLGVTLEMDHARDPQEEDLLGELADDIGFALHSLEQERRQRQAEETVRSQRSLLAAMLNASPDLMFLKDADLRHRMVNPAFCRHVGREAAEIIGQGARQVFPEAEAAVYEEADRRVLATGEPDVREVEIETPSGRRWVHAVKTAVREEDGRITGLLGSLRDITDIKRAEEAVKSLAELPGQNPNPILRVSRDGVLLYANRSAEPVLQAWGCQVGSPVPIPWRESVQEVLQTGLNRSREEEYAGRTFVLTAAFLARSDYVNVYGVDVTERVRVEQQLRQAQKMEAIGRLAGGVAHDFNNQLTVIEGYCSLLLKDLPADSPVRRAVEHIRKASSSAARLTSELLTFGRRQLLKPSVVNVGALAEEVREPLARMIGEHVRLCVQAAPDVRLTRVDPGFLRQALFNLVINARDAMPGGGRIMIETANVDLDARYVAKHPGSRVGPHVLLAVTDTGAGMDRETLSHIFEPFFTTKAVGHGTGLGLSMVYGFVKQCGGSIYVYSEPGRGTTFKVYMPALMEGAAPAPPAEEPAAEAPAVQGLVLVVEDDEAVRDLVVQVLRQFGQEVLAAGGPEEALARAREQGRPIALLLTDVIMPVMNGPELARRVREVSPETRVLYCSGYAENAIVHHGFVDAGANLLAKPFTADALIRAVSRVLGSEAQRPDGEPGREP